MDFLRAALYIRVSHEEQVRDGYSLDAQRKYLLEYAKKHNYTVVDVYSDEGVSARKSYKYRKEFLRLLDDVRAGKIDIILFIKLDRWFRSISDYYKVQEILEKYNVGWKATTENYDTTTSSGRLYVNIRLSVAQDEADRTGERIKFVFDRKISQGEVVSGSVPLGYKIENKKLVVDQEKAEIIKQLFRTYLDLKSKRAAMFRVQEAFGYKLSYSSVLNYLKNKMYTGQYRDNPNYCPPIIDQKLFDQVQNQLRDSSVYVPENPIRHCYIFSGLVLCPECGRIMSGKKNGRYQKDSYCYYRCAYDSCSYRKYINEKKLEKYLLDHIHGAVADYKIEYTASAKKKKPSPLITKKTIETKMSRLRDLYVEQFLTMEEYRSEFAKLQEQLSKIKNDHQEEPKDFFYLDQLLQSNFFDIYNTLDNENKRILWSRVLRSIIPNTDGEFVLEFL